MNVLVFGGSKNIGYFAAQRLLASEATVTFLLRNKSSFDDDDSMKPYISSGKAQIVVGDALNEDDVRRAWEVSAQAKDGLVDAMVFTVGGTPKFNISNFGFVIDPANLCTRAMLNTLATMPRTSPQPRIILISSMGVGKASHASVPLALKPLYGMLAPAHADKLGMEYVVAHAAGWTWAGRPPAEGILPAGWKERLPAPGFLKEVLVLRPALLLDGPCKADEPKEKRKGAGYRAADKPFSGCYTISRRDVAHFIVVQALGKWRSWADKSVAIGY